MVVSDLDIVGVFTLPDKTRAPLVVYANAILSRSVALQGFQAVSWWEHQVSQRSRAVNLRQLAQSHALNVRRQAMIAAPLPQSFGLPTGKTDDHPSTIIEYR